MAAETSRKQEVVSIRNNAQSMAHFEPPPFVPHPWLRGGHRQTLAGNFFGRENHLPLAEERLFQVEDGVRVLCQCHWQPNRAQATTLIIVHGLEGSSASGYVIGTANQAWDFGFNIVRMNMRNCGGTEELTPTLYHSGLSGDVGAILQELIHEEHLPSIVLAGFSMGGNLVMKLLGELAGDAPPQLVAAVTVSPAMDLASSVQAIHRPSNRLYEWRFLRGLNQRLRFKAQLFPDRYRAVPLLSIRSLWDFDDQVTARYCGFEGADDYYAKAGASRVIDQIRVPTLLIHALDDPFIVMTPATRAKVIANPHIRFVETEHGGHCAFVASNSNAHRNSQTNGLRKNTNRWAEQQVVAFARYITESGM